MLVERPFEWWAKRAEAEEPCDVYAGGPVLLTPDEVARRQADAKAASERAKALWQDEVGLHPRLAARLREE
jgi:hypothetical protein